ncbi:hypothetical protein J2X01_002290 [Arthrobacter ginsengisoli]|uniref:Integral membrane protein n=1 Tax=Arthrobacter ginsengisoli TaxID=1356565 RepID=A0ABU1UD02_9MICC|nr:hypothetical protein [Arthrobacter ginsengisoli]MDR7083000.1 hypothetical protein [Arthrobacter ginsengisoli]
MPIDQLAAIVACAILAGLGIFQGALIGGVPLGRMAWGGQHAVLPARLRIGSAVSIALYALFAYTALARAELTPPVVNENATAVFVWALTAYFALGVVMNGISRSKPERLVMTPVALVLAALYLVLSLS